MKNEWIKTEEMLQMMKEHPNVEMEFTHYLGSMLRSTYWGMYDSTKRRFGLSTDWDYSCEYTEKELLEFFDNHLWRRDA